jgi:prepilin-type N-terminal cleavage/methylation domain-containing protein
MKKAFTLIELIFAIVIIGVLASVAIPKFSGLTGNSKVAAELSTAASIQTALEACHGEWIINENEFTCANGINSSMFTSNGYPLNLGDTNNPINYILKNAPNTWSTNNDGTKFYGPASNVNSGNTNCKENKPCIGKYWVYDNIIGTFSLQ